MSCIQHTTGLLELSQSFASHISCALQTSGRDLIEGSKTQALQPAVWVDSQHMWSCLQADG